MNRRGVCFGGLALVLVARAAPLFGQDSPWRSAAAPQPVAVEALPQLRPCPAATLGRPEPLPAGAGTVTPAALRPASYFETGLTVRGSSDGPQWTDDADQAGDKGTDFAVDRPAAVAAAAAPAGGLRLVGMSGTDMPANLPASLPKGLAAAPAAPPVLADDDASRPTFYVSGEYLLWWLKQDKVPVLATTSTNPFDNGILGRPTTQVLFGGDGIDGSARSGFRFTAGYWLDCTCKEEAIEFRGFYFAPNSTNFSVNSSEFPVIARPFFNVNMQEEFSQLTAFPGVQTGSLTIHDKSDFWGAEVNGRCNLCCGCNYRLDVLGGFRYLQLEDSLNITEDVLGLPAAGPPFANNRFLVNDLFLTRNQFYGGQVGLLGEWDRGPFSVEGRAQVALGDTNQEILIDGSQILTMPNGTQQRFTGGLLALRSNIGRIHRDRFSVVPELGLNVGYQLTSHVRAFVGYDFLYWNNVARPGGQIDRNLDITLIPNFPVPGAVPAGQNRPSAPRDSTDLWAQGVTFGLEFRY